MTDKEKIEETNIQTSKVLQKINEDAKLPLDITDKMIRFGQTSYPVRNIASVSTITKEFTIKGQTKSNGSKV